MDMRKGAEGTVTKHQDPHSSFLKKSIRDGIPANLIIIIDTHSDTFSGQLQATGGLTGVSTTLSLPDLVSMYVGESILQEMVAASLLARGYNDILEISTGLTPWADITPKARGGWRVLVMVSCGSAVRQPYHWEYITQLFRR